MEFYNSNLESLKQKNTNLYNRILKTQETLAKEKENEIYIEEARNGSSILGVRRGDWKVSLNSRYNPEHEAKMWVKGFSWNGYENVFLMFGLENGTYIRSLIK